MTKPRTRKKPGSKIKVEEEQLKKGPVWIDGYLHMSLYDLNRYMHFYLAVNNAQQAMALKRSAIEETKRNANDRIAGLTREAAQLDVDMKRYSEKFRSLIVELTNLYDIPFEDVVIDDDTGRISVPDKDEEGRIVDYSPVMDSTPSPNED